MSLSRVPRGALDCRGALGSWGAVWSAPFTFLSPTSCGSRDRGPPARDDYDRRDERRDDYDRRDRY